MCKKNRNWKKWIYYSFLGRLGLIMSTYSCESDKHDTINGESLEVRSTVFLMIFKNHLAFRILAWVVFLPTGSTLTVGPLSIHSLTTISYSTEVTSRLIPGTFTSHQLNINMLAGSDSTEATSRLTPGTLTSLRLNINVLTGSDSTEVTSRLIPCTFTSHQLNINMLAGSDSTEVTSRLTPGTFTSLQICVHVF